MTTSTFLDRAQMTVASAPGTGTITLGSATTGYQTLVAAGAANGNQISYVLIDGLNWEYGHGTYTTSGTTLSRGSILGSSNGGAAITASAKSIVTASLLAEDVAAVLALVSAAKPCGRLTLTTLTPVLTSTVNGATSVIFTPYEGNSVPLWNGTVFVATPFAEVSQLLSDTAKSPAAAVANSIYDMFVWLDGSTIRCTRGPVWPTNATRTLGLSLINGIYVNTSSITNGPAAGYGTHVGIIMTDASAATVSWIYGTAASGGGAGWFGINNRYNKKRQSSTSIDTTTSWTYAGVAYRAANNSSTIRCTILQDIDDPFVKAFYSVIVQTPTTVNAGTLIGVCLDATSGLSGVGGYVLTAVSTDATTASHTGSYDGGVGAGRHFLTAVEFSLLTTGITFIGGPQFSGLVVTFEA